MANVKTCGDCIHAYICKKVNGGWFSPKNIAYCTAFKERKNCVEVVLCKDCKWRREWLSGGTFFCCNPYYGMASGVELKDNDFCSYGERREGE